MWPGSQTAYGAQKTRPTYNISFNKSISVETRIDALISWIKNPTKPANVVFTYVDQPDATAHGSGPSSSRVIEAIKKVDYYTGYLTRKLRDNGLNSRANLIIVSDHGFADVKKENSIHIDRFVSPTLHYESGNGPIRHITPKDGKFDEVYRKLSDASINNHFSVYKRENIPERWHYRNRRVGPIFLVAKLPYTFDNLSDGSRTYGTHGYDNEEPQMRPFFFSYGPSFKKNTQVAPFRGIDLFPLFCNVLNLRTPSNNGSLEYVKGLLA